jgi:hypothetical protein
MMAFYDLNFTELVTGVLVYGLCEAACKPLRTGKVLKTLPVLSSLICPDLLLVYAK